MESEGLLRFLKTKRSKEELLVCLSILNEFKMCESSDEWISSPFSNWIKLEQLEDYLKLLTNTDIDTVKDEKAIKFYQRNKIEDI